MKSRILFIILILFGFCAESQITILTDSAGGHKGVTGSLMRGLAQNGIVCNHNPSVGQLWPTVVVLADTLQLRNAIQLKQQGKIKKLLAGPNLVTRPTECNSIVASKEIDAYLVPSEWCVVAYEEDEPRLKNRIKLWPAGIDTNYWNPANDNRTNEIIIYLKYEPRSFANQVETLVRKYGYSPIIIEYGKYKIENYRTLLNRVQAAIFLSRSESQGLALAEAWAMNVPTLAWNPQELIAHGRTYSEVSACPLLTPSTGVDWKTFDQLEDILKQFNHLKKNFEPRQWMLDNLTDKKSAKILLDIIDTINN